MLANRSICGIRVTPQAPTFSHLLFADDSMIFFRIKDNTTDMIKETLMKYENVPGKKNQL